MVALLIGQGEEQNRIQCAKLQCAHRIQRAELIKETSWNQLDVEV